MYNGLDFEWVIGDNYLLRSGDVAVLQKVYFDTVMLTSIFGGERVNVYRKNGRQFLTTQILHKLDVIEHLGRNNYTPRDIEDYI